LNGFPEVNLILRDMIVLNLFYTCSFQGQNTDWMFRTLYRAPKRHLLLVYFVIQFTEHWSWNQCEWFRNEIKSV